jgi:hypothetical protein
MKKSKQSSTTERNEKTVTTARAAERDNIV